MKRHTRCALVTGVQTSALPIYVPKTLPEKSSFPTTLAEFEAFDYDHHCGTTVSGIQGIDPKEFIEASQNNDTLIVDVRDADELPVLFADHLHIPLDELSEKLNLINKNRVDRKSTRLKSSH